MAATQTSKIVAPEQKPEKATKAQHISRNGRDGHGIGRTSRDATSINSSKRAPIDPSMPDMPPA